MRKSQSSEHLFQVRIRQLGNPTIREGFGYDKRGDAVPDLGNNRHTRRMLKAALRKDKALAIKSGSRGDNQ